MTGEINRVPTGLLNLLDLAARGQSPRVLAPQVAGTVELTPLYLQQNRRNVTGNTSTINAVGTWSCNIVVPQNEIWWVHAFTVRFATLAAGTTYRLVPAYRPGPSGVESQDLGAVAQTFTAGERPFLGAVNVPFIVPPGGDFIVNVIAVTLGTGGQFVGAVDYTPLSI